MLEIRGDLWNLTVSIRCITTNGTIDKHGAAVMGKGVALQAKTRYPGIEQELGNLLRKNGNHVHELSHGIVAFPTKHQWWDMKSDMTLIEQSALELVHMADQRGWKRIGMVQPGTGNGGLSWEHVSNRISPMLDSRFIVVSR